MADIAVTLVGMLSKDMPRPGMLRVDTPLSVLAVDVVILRGPRADTRAMQGAHIIGMAAVTGEAITGIRLMDILDWAITAWAMAIHTTAMAIRTTGVATTDITLTATDTGRR